MAKKSSSSTRAKSVTAPLSAALRQLADMLEGANIASDPAVEPALQELGAALEKVQSLLSAKPKSGRQPSAKAAKGKVKPAALEAPVDFGMPIDREANRALQFWGKMSLTDFLQKWPMFDSDMLKRAASAVGLPHPKRWSRAAQEDLHRCALRFVRNTFV